VKRSSEFELHAPQVDCRDGIGRLSHGAHHRATGRHGRPRVDRVEFDTGDRWWAVRIQWVRGQAVARVDRSPVRIGGRCRSGEKAQPDEENDPAYHAHAPALMDGLDHRSCAFREYGVGDDAKKHDGRPLDRIASAV
jgi:hypothetical protein